MRRIVLLLLLLIAVALAVNTVLTERETKAAKADVGRILELPGTDLQVRERGPVDAPPIVLLHCYTCSIHWWARLEPLLTRRNRVISIDLPGHGGSEKPGAGYAMDEQADQIAKALERLGVRRALIVGQSLGGVVGTALADRHPGLARGIVIMDAPVRREYRNLPLTARLGSLPVIGHAGWQLATDDMVREGLSTAFVDGGKIPERFVEGVGQMTFTAFRESPSQATDYITERHLDDRLADVGLPLLVIYGAEDEVVKPPDEAADEYRDIPGARVVMLPGVGHTPQWEQAGRSAELVLQLDRKTR